MHFLLELAADVIEFSELKSADTMSLGMTSGPIDTGEFDPMTGLIDDFHLIGAEGEFNGIDFKEWGLGDEIFLELVVVLHEFLVFVVRVAHGGEILNGGQ